MSITKRFNPLIKKSSLLRGLVMDSLSRLETRMDLYIARYFCKDEHTVDEFASTFLKSQSLIIGFRKKIDIFISIFKNKDEALYNNLGDVKADLIFINTQRNIFAHQIIDTSDEGLKLYNENGTMRFVQFRDKKEKLTISQKTRFIKY